VDSGVNDEDVLLLEGGDDELAAEPNSGGCDELDRPDVQMPGALTMNPATNVIPSSSLATNTWLSDVDMSIFFVT